MPKLRRYFCGSQNRGVPEDTPEELKIASVAEIVDSERMAKGMGTCADALNTRALA